MNKAKVNKLTIGLTGGIGSGKSVVANLFHQKGITIIDTDIIARQVVAPNTPGLQAIIEHFGDQFLTAGQLDRGRLREFIFQHPQEKQWLENLLHPLIRIEMLEQINAASSPYCIVVIPLLIENHPHPLIQRILVVDAPETMQIQRTVSRDQISPTLAKQIIAAQASREERLKVADDVIDNTTDLASLAHAVEQLHEKYLSLVSKNY